MMKFRLPNRYWTKWGDLRPSCNRCTYGIHGRYPAPHVGVANYLKSTEIRLVLARTKWLVCCRAYLSAIPRFTDTTAESRLAPTAG